VAAQLAEHGRGGERDERTTALRVEAIEGLEQTNHRDLAEVVERLLAALEPVGETHGEWREGVDHALA
jgi:hypothetical protein